MFPKLCEALPDCDRRVQIKKGQIDHVGVVFFNSEVTDNPWNHSSCKIQLPLKELDQDTVTHLEDLAHGRRQAKPHAKMVDDDEKSHLDLALWCCTSIFNESAVTKARKAIYILTCNDDLVGESFAGSSKADRKQKTAEDECVQRVKDSVEKGILIDVWPLNDAESAVDDGDMPNTFQATDFWKRFLEASIADISEESILAATKDEEIEERLSGKRYACARLLCPLEVSWHRARFDVALSYVDQSRI